MREWEIVEGTLEPSWPIDGLTALATAISVETFGEDRTTGREALRSWMADEHDALKGCLLVVAGEAGEPGPTGRFGVPVPGAEPREVLASAEFRIPLPDNTHLLDDGWIQVRADRRRRGLGSALLAEVERIAAGHARSTVLLWSDHIVGSLTADDPQLHPPTGGGVIPLDGAARFSFGHGYSLEQVERQSRLELPVDPDHLATLRRDAEAHALPAYRLVSFTGPTPPELRDAVAEMNRVLSTDAPTGGIDWHAEVWDAERVAIGERRHEGVGTAFTTMAFHAASGEVAATTRIFCQFEHPERPEQWNTSVVAAHRGHRLGLLVKVANLQQLALHWPQAVDLMTWNAGENDHMLAINTAIGYRPYAATGAWQRVLDPTPR